MIGRPEVRVQGPAQHEEVARHDAAGRHDAAARHDAAVQPSTGRNGSALPPHAFSRSESRDLAHPCASHSTLVLTCSEATCRSISSHSEDSSLDSVDLPVPGNGYPAHAGPIRSQAAGEEAQAKERVLQNHVGRQRMGQLLRNVVTSRVAPWKDRHPAAALQSPPVTVSHAPPIPPSPCSSEPVPSSPSGSTPPATPPRLSCSSASSAHRASFPYRSPFAASTPSPPFSACPSPAVLIPSLADLQASRTSSAHLSARVPSSASPPVEDSHGSHVTVPAEPASSASLPPPGFQRALLDCCACRGAEESTAAVLERQVAGARQIRHMARDLEGCRAVMVEKGAVGTLLPLLDWAEGGPGVQPWLDRSVGDGVTGENGRLRDLRMKVVEEAVTALLNLSIHPSSIEIMPKLGVVRPVVQMVGSRQWDASQSSSRSSSGSLSNSSVSSSGSGNLVAINIREIAAALVFSLSQAVDNRAELVRSGAAESLVQLLQEPRCSGQGRKDACKALFNFSTCSVGRLSLVRAGAVPVMLELAMMGSADEYISEKAMGVLANVAREEAGREAIFSAQVSDGAWDLPGGNAGYGNNELPQASDSLSMTSGLNVFLETLDGGTERSKEFAVSALLSIAKSSIRWKELLLMEGPLPSIKAVAMRGNTRARHKAQTLYELLRS
ncbi:hypothetical protein CLOM_g2445 [Closterium sp. NIES-68]|nr:hypothetical protein CLOM_g2445 [Closterium sp. NIES-68]GJP74370.1 hypothetical protein CLOP_g4961 [Closterium sp. NIES-67]